MPSVTLLPTPEPEKMPIRWPRPQVSRPSIARTPVESGVSIRGRSVAGGGAPASGRPLGQHGRRAMVDGSSAGVDHAAQQFRADAQRPPRLPQAHAVAVPDARHFAKRIDDRFLAAKADDFSFDRRLPPAARSPRRRRPARAGPPPRRPAPRCGRCCRDRRGQDGVELC